MHRGLQIPEILCIILDLLAEDQAAYGADSHLLAVMKTCRAFQIPAVGRIWKRLRNIVPLIATMPQDLWEIKLANVPQGPKLLRFRRKVKPSDWTRFDLYAAHVQEIGCTRRLEYEFTYTVLDEPVLFELKRRAMPILPHLQKMVALMNDLALAPTLLSPRLQRMRFVMRADDIPLLTRLATALPVFAPNLRSLELRAFGPWLQQDISTMQTATATLLSGLDLNDFRCRWNNFLTESTLHAIVQMPSLRKLYIGIDLETVYAVLQSTRGRDPEITHFSLTATMVTTFFVPKIIALLNGSSLEVLCIEGGEADKPSDLLEVTSAVAKHCSPSRLTKLELQYGSETQPIANLTSLRPLLPFTFLQTVVITSHLSALSDNDAKTLAQSWPRLRVLGLAMSSLYSPEICGTLSLHGVLYFAKYCRHLRALAVEFFCTGSETKYNAEPTTEVSANTDPGIPKEVERDLAAGTARPASSIPTETEALKAANSNTWFLTVGRSTIPDALRVASFLRVLFPRLEMLNWTANPDGDNEDNNPWHVVEEIIREAIAPLPGEPW